MSKRASHDPGTFCWVDLTAHDMEAAAAWYGQLFGWDMELAPSHGGPPYGMFTLNGQPVAGIGQASDEMKQHGVPPTWNSYVAVADAAESEKRALSLGARPVFPTSPAGDAGSLAFLSDPQGAVFALWQPASHTGAALVNEPGTFCWNELNSSDVAASRQFYGELFGWEFKSDGGTPEYVEIITGDRAGGGMMAIQSEWGEVPPHWMVYFDVEDVEASTRAVEASGGGVILPPKTIEGVGTFSVVRDPQGAVFSLITLENREVAA